MLKLNYYTEFMLSIFAIMQCDMVQAAVSCGNYLQRQQAPGLSSLSRSGLRQVRFAAGSLSATVPLACRRASSPMRVFTAARRAGSTPLQHRESRSVARPQRYRNATGLQRDADTCAAGNLDGGATGNCITSSCF